MESDDNSTGVAEMPDELRAKRRRMLTINEFCEEVGFSRTGFYNLRAKGCAPRVIKLGNTRTSPLRIPIEEVEAWKRQRLEEVDLTAVAPPPTRVLNFPPKSKANGKAAGR